MTDTVRLRHGLIAHYVRGPRRAARPTEAEPTHTELEAAKFLGITVDELRDIQAKRKATR